MPALPEAAAVPWRARASPRTLSRSARLWTLTALAHSIPFLLTAGVLALLMPATLPVGAILIAHGWIIPELYAARGANVVRVRGRAGASAERCALLLLGDLIDHGARELHARCGLVLEPGDLGIWLVGEEGALLLPAGGRRVHCFCVHTVNRDLPSGDRIAHLLLALREDEAGFATVANQAFCGATWRLRRRLTASARVGLDAAAQAARRSIPTGSAGLRRRRGLGSLRG